MALGRRFAGSHLLEARMRLPSLPRVAVLAALLSAAIPTIGPASAQTPAPRPATEQTFEDEKRKALDTLFAALHRTADEAAAAPIVAEIWQTWSRSGRPDIDIMMDKASAAMQSRNYGLAVLLLDEVIDEAPLFGEGWNRRATLRMTMGDSARALSDVEKALALEPRHFGALATRGLIHMAAQRWPEALTAWRAALAVNPFIKERHRVIPELERRVERDRL